MFFFRASEPLAPRTKAAADGTYPLAGLPAQGNVSVHVNHAEYGQGDAWYVTGYAAADKRAPDVEMPDGIVIEGTVRYAGTDRPAAGAKVWVGSGLPDEVSNEATADEKGHYRLAGLDRAVFSRGRFAVSARAGAAGDESSEWEGQAVHEGDLYAGDVLGDVDVTLVRSFTWRFNKWLKQAGKPAATATRVVVIDDADPAMEGKDRYADTLRVYDAAGAASGTPSWEYGALHVSKYSRPLAANAADGAAWVCEGPGGRVMKFDRGGKLQWEKSALKAGALALHPPTGNAWLLTQDRLIYGKDLLVLDPAGTVVHQAAQPGYDLAYSAFDDSFWAVGQKAQKLDRLGKVLCESPARFGWMARVVAVDDKDGTAWVAADRHRDVPDSVNRILLLAPDGRMRRDVPLGEAGAADVLLDPARQCAWVPTATAGGASALLKLSDAGDVLGEYPVSGSSVALEPDTGYVWVAGPRGLFRVDTDGRVVWGERTKAQTSPDDGLRRWVFVLGP